MKCEEFKKNMTTLWDKSINTEEKEELMRHVMECEDCRSEYESQNQIVNMLTPHHTPRMRKEPQKTPEVRKNPEWSKKLMRIAAAAAIFIAGVCTGLSNFFSTDAQASKSSELAKQALLSIRSVGNFIMELSVRTQPDEPFSHFSPDDSLLNVRIMSMRMNGKSIWRIEKEGGRTLVFDGNKKYAWAGEYKYVGAPNDNLEENFSVLLKGDKYDAEENGFFGTGKHNNIKFSDTDSTTIVTVVSERPGNGLIALYNNNTSGKHDLYTIESTFGKRDGLLRKIRIWIEQNGIKTLMLESRHIAYNVAMDSNRILQIPDSESKNWLSDDKLKNYRLNKSLRKETATEAAERILRALTENKPETAKEALFFYSQGLDKMTEMLKECKATNFSQPKRTEDYSGVYVFYELTYPDGKKQKRHVALKFDTELKGWILDGGF